jgi:hypothetical protein
MSSFKIQDLCLVETTDLRFYDFSKCDGDGKPGAVKFTKLNDEKIKKNNQNTVT